MKPIDLPLMEGFQILLRGELFVEQARRRVASTVDEYHWTTHAEKVGGPKPVQEAAVIEIGDDGKVATYSLFSSGAVLHRAVFGQNRALLTLRDGNEHELALTVAPDLVLQQNLLLQLSRCLAALDRDEGPRKLHYFSPEALAVRDFDVAPAGALDWETSIGIRLNMSASGALVSAVGMDEKGTLIGRAGPPVFHAAPIETLRGAEESIEPPPPPPGIDREEVTIESEDITLHGLFVHGRKPAGPSPACLFLNGSGSITRWGGAPGMRLKTLETMDALAQVGVASLAIDARGAGKTGFGKADRPLGATRLADAAAAWRWLAARADIDALHLFAAGHSLGALVILQLLSTDPALAPAGLILLAPPGRPLRDILMEQNARESARLHVSEEEAGKRDAALRQWLDREARTDGAELRLGGLRPLTDPAVLETDPRAAVGAVRCPMLILHGDKDIQTSADRDAKALHRAARSHNVRSTYKEIHNADHLFRLEPEVSTPERYRQDLPPNPEYLAAVAEWIAGLAASAPKPRR